MAFEYRGTKMPRASLKLIIALAALSGPAVGRAQELVAVPMTAATFQHTLDDMTLRLGPIVRRRFHKIFLATGDWSQDRTPMSVGGMNYHPVVNSPRGRENAWGVNIEGWLAKEPGMTSDSVQFVLCHELGHHVHGTDQEIKADQFTAGCLKLLWTVEGTERWLAAFGQFIAPQVRTQCAKLQGIPGAFCLRLFTAYAPAERVRMNAWAVHFNPLQTQRMAACRREAIRQGFLGGKDVACGIQR